MKHLLTIDVEEWYDGLPRHAKPCSRRMQPQVERLLSVLSDSGTKATFFWLGSRVKGYESFMRRIAAEGHEIACHGWTHDFLDQQTERKLREDLSRAKHTIEDAVGKEITGFRAPYFSIGEGSVWILDVLADLGFKYDSSIHPIHYWRYGFASFPTRPTLLTTPAGELLELPISVRKIAGLRVPYAGGAYFRFLSYEFISHCIQLAEAKDEQVVFYLHPWELDADHPKVFIPSTVQLSHYWRLASAETKLRRLLGQFEFSSIQQGREIPSELRNYAADFVQLVPIVR